MPTLRFRWKCGRQRDPLTGLLNHRACYDRLRQEIARTTRIAGALSLVVIDIDDFKQTNDLFGHLEGDDLLRRTARLILAVSRGGDVVGRVGGDEFAVMLTDCADPVERIEQRIGDVVASGGRVSVTTGAATLRANDDPRSLVDRADSVLLRRKRDRRGVALRT